MYGVLFWAKQTSYPQELAGRDRPSAGRFQLVLSKNKFENIKRGMNGQRGINGPFLFKYYVSKLGGSGLSLC